MACLGHVDLRAGWGTITTTTKRFRGPSTVVIEKSGTGTVYLKEQFKNLEAYLIPGGMNRAQFKWGIIDDVQWEWTLKYLSNGGSECTVTFWGCWQFSTDLTYPGLPEGNPNDPNNPNNPEYSNRLPKEISIRIDENDELLWIYINLPGNFTIRVYKEFNNNYVLYSEQENCIGEHYHLLQYPRRSKFWVVIYSVINVDGKISLDYIGDRLYPAIPSILP